MGHAFSFLAGPSLTARILVALAGLLLVSACDVQGERELVPGQSSEADVRQRFGQPEAVWDEPDGVRIYEFNRQPAGHRNYMATIGADGRLIRFEQVLHPANFSRVQPGMPMEQVRRLLGKPMKITPYPLKGETHYDWRFLDGPTDNDSKIFTVVFDTDFRVSKTLVSRDPALDRN
ncbi:MAG TPA: outer membrane protein assembly factor BamE [Hydrogenophaga sp.]|uniref:outer membrane protein assembly factor BamE domain-containing protein n=1 Tax=Hydrogenophaga sp. TaxID=1904254 RepID=UPI002CB87C7C|nr:outer membrane protein assembly factor BamE [Hydrogenophaga sp.]HMN93352.1 outer membrane protein assembly factor BamE [Hydrogenophaga sp.]HMP10802.1 outer membrane protein assembly factor BamE [Hydrogenophaga sp.]